MAFNYLDFEDSALEDILLLELLALRGLAHFAELIDQIGETFTSDG